MVLFFLFIATLFIHTSLADQSSSIYRYLQKAGGKIDTATQTVSVSGDILTIRYHDTKGHTSISQCSAIDYRMISWRFVNPQKQTDVTVTRKGTELIICGISKGKQINRSQVIDNLPWFQALELSLAPYCGSAGSGAEFWLVRPTDFTVFRMKLQRSDKAAAIASVNGAAFELRMSPSGIPERLWKATMLVTEAGTFLQSYLPSLLPGKPPVIETALPSEPGS